MAMKYIVYKTNEGEVPLIFPNSFCHKGICKSIGEDVIVSAGFIKQNQDGYLECYGKSVSLKLKSRERHDTILINHYLSLNSV